MESKLKDFVLKTNELLSSLESMVTSLTEEERDRLNLLVTGPVGLRDINKFNLAIHLPSNKELQIVRRELASAIATEKWTEGFIFAMQLVALMGG